MIFLEQVQRFGDSRVALIGFPSAGTFGSKLPLLSCMFEESMACVGAISNGLQATIVTNKIQIAF